MQEKNMNNWLVGLATGSTKADTVHANQNGSSGTSLAQRYTCTSGEALQLQTHLTERREKAHVDVPIVRCYTENHLDWVERHSGQLGRMSLWQVTGPIPEATDWLLLVRVPQLDHLMIATTEQS